MMNSMLSVSHDNGRYYTMYNLLMKLYCSDCFLEVLLAVLYVLPKIACCSNACLFRRYFSQVSSICRLPRWHSGKEPTCQGSRCRFTPGVRKIPQSRRWQPPVVFLFGKPPGRGAWLPTALGEVEHWVWLSDWALTHSLVHLTQETHRGRTLPTHTCFHDGMMPSSFSEVPIGKSILLLCVLTKFVSCLKYYTVFVFTDKWCCYSCSD